jgi:hypothetical protein
MIYVCEHHDEILSLWRRLELGGIRLAHVDFHDDLQGLIINRRRGIAFARRALLKDEVHPGNFLAKAVIESRLDAVRWVHDIPGGRGWDTGVVKYTSDPSVMIGRIRRTIELKSMSKYKFEFEEIRLRKWTGPETGERLSVDWDCFASILQDRATVTERVNTFIAHLGDHIPVDSYFCYSPDYSHRDSLSAFIELVDLLSRRYGQNVEWLSPGLKEGKLNPEGIDTTLPSAPLARFRLFLRRYGLW